MIALTVGAALVAALLLYLRLERTGASGLPLAALRAVAWGSVGVLLINPSCHRAGVARTDVLLDGSLSMTDPSGDARWRAAVDTAHAAAGRDGRIIVFGENPFVLTAGTRPAATASLLLPALREAAARGSRVVIVTDGLVDDAASLPDDLLRGARIVVLPRAPHADAGIAGFTLPPALRAGDTASARIDVVAAGSGAADTATLELLEQGRVVARTRIALGTGGSMARDLAFVPSAGSREPGAVPSVPSSRTAPGNRLPGGGPQVRRYEARLTGFAADREPRDDVRHTAANVSQASAIALFSDAPDWDFRWLSRTLTASSGVPVHAYVRLGAAGWRDAHSMHPVSDAAVRAEAQAAALVVAHGTAEGVDAMSRLAHRALWQWVTVPKQVDASANGDWYVAPPELASPVGGALAGVPAESLPPLDMVLELRTDSVMWTGLVAQLDRRGRSRSIVQGSTVGERRVVSVGATGLWRWASHGGIAEEGYRALAASLTDWLLEAQAGAPASLAALRDSLARGIGEFLPRDPALHSQPGSQAAAIGEPEPLRFSPWLYIAALLALVTEWMLRRRRGLR